MATLNNLIGKTFGKLTVKSRADNINGKTAWVCECECGNTIVRRSDSLHNNSMCRKCQYDEKKKYLSNRNKKPHKYSVNEIISCKSSDIQVLDLLRLKNNNDVPFKAYKYKCIKCGNIDYISESHLLSGRGCNACRKSARKIVLGVNDIPTTNPEIVKFFQNGEEEAKNFTKSSTKVINFKCPECGEIISKRICDVSRHNSLGCKCSQHKSYPEKYVFSMLKQLNIDFTTEKYFDWSGLLRYDFYFVIDNISVIIEVHGNQHYSNSRFNTYRSLFEEQENDRLKERLAKDNNINHYIIIDARKSESKYLSTNICKSTLNNILDLHKINWELCNDYATANIIKEVCEFYKCNSNYTSKEIALIFNVSDVTIQNWLHKGTIHGWCEYNPIHYGSKPVRCITTNTIYESQVEAARQLNINPASISCCLRGKTKTAGKDPKTGERLKWERVS